VKASCKDFSFKLESFKTVFVSAMGGLGERLDNVELSLMRVVVNANAASARVTPVKQANHHSGIGETADRLPRTMNYGSREMINICDETVDKLAVRVESRINLVEKKLNRLVVKSGK
jgi:hypothetical protein